MVTIPHGSTEHNNKFLEKYKAYIIVAISDNYNTSFFSHSVVLGGSRELHIQCGSHVFRHFQISITFITNWTILGKGLNCAAP